VILTSLDVDAAELASRTGWHLRPEGACKGEVCVPLAGTGAEVRGDGTIDARALAERLGMPLVADERVADLWSLGPESAVTGRALTSAVAPELTLPDLRTGEDFSLASLRGQKVVLLAWASW
jgi:hypothetical protein